MNKVFFFGKRKIFLSFIPFLLITVFGLYCSIVTKGGVTIETLFLIFFIIVYILMLFYLYSFCIILDESGLSSNICFRDKIVWREKFISWESIGTVSMNKGGLVGVFPKSKSLSRNSGIVISKNIVAYRELLCAIIDKLPSHIVDRRVVELINLHK